MELSNLTHGRQRLFPAAELFAFSTLCPAFLAPHLVPTLAHTNTIQNGPSHSACRLYSPGIRHSLTYVSGSKEMIHGKGDSRDKATRRCVIRSDGSAGFDRSRLCSRYDQHRLFGSAIMAIRQC